MIDERLRTGPVTVVRWLSVSDKLHSTNPIERLNKEVKRRADVVGIFPNEASIRRLVGALLLEQNDEWQLQHRYMSLETMAGLADETAAPPKIAA